MQEVACLGVPALGHAQFGHALQRVCFAGRCADLAVQVDGFLQLVLRSGQIAGEQGCFARQRGRERDRPQGARRVLRSRATNRRAPSTSE